MCSIGLGCMFLLWTADPPPGAPELKINYLNERKLETLLSGDLDAQWSQLERLLRSHSLCMLILLLLCFWIRSPFYNSRVQLDFKTAPRAKRVRLYGREWSRSGFVEGRDKGATQLLNGGDRISEGSRELMIGFYCFFIGSPWPLAGGILQICPMEEQNVKHREFKTN